MKGFLSYRMAGCMAGMLVLFSSFWCGPGYGDMLQKKSYVVRSDQGRDLLCEPYIVRKNDWVYKLFRQKGEISHLDFPEFLIIFKRLNPHVRNINTIRPGQTILIPLKKLDYGSFPGQAEGIVTIPFVTISKVSDILRQYSSRQKINRGDTLYGIMSREFAPLGSDAFNQGMKLFLSINTGITDLNRIYAGQTIRVPDPAITRQSWYASLFDEAGNLKTEMAMTDPLGPPPPQDYAAAPVTETENLKPGRPETENLVSPLARAAKIVNARLRTRGAYYFPTPGGSDFQLDLSRFPLIELKNGHHIIFQDKDILFKTDLDKIRSAWPEVEVASSVLYTSLRQLLDLFLSGQEGSYVENHLNFSDQGMDITLRANWITRIGASNKNDQDRLCITLIESPDERTAPDIVRYLADHHILIKEIVYPIKTNTAPGLPGSPNKKTVIREPVSIGPSDIRTVVARMVTTLGFSYAPDIPITFPYAGIQVAAKSNLVSGANGHSVLVDFCDLYGDAMDAIKKSGLDIVQVKSADPPDLILERLLTAMAIPFQAKPVFWAARRPEFFNTAITLPGLLIRPGGQSKILFSGLDLNKNIVRFLQENGISVVRSIQD